MSTKLYRYILSHLYGFCCGNVNYRTYIMKKKIKDISEYKKEITELANAFKEEIAKREKSFPKDWDLSVRYNIVNNAIMAFMFHVLRTSLEDSHSKEEAVIAYTNDLRKHFEQYVASILKEYAED